MPFPLFLGRWGRKEKKVKKRSSKQFFRQSSLASVTSSLVLQERKRREREEELAFFSFLFFSSFCFRVPNHVHFVEAADVGHHLRRWVRRKIVATGEGGCREESIWPPPLRPKNVEMSIAPLLLLSEEAHTPFAPSLSLSLSRSNPPFNSRRRYRLGRKIGSGSFGDIYLGKQLNEKENDSPATTAKERRQEKEKPWLPFFLLARLSPCHPRLFFSLLRELAVS